MNNITIDPPSEVPAPVVQSEWRHWRSLLASSLGYGTGISLLIMTGSLFLDPMRRDLGWSLTGLSFLPLVSVMAALGNPLAGFLVDRFGSRLIAAIGLILFCAGTAALSIIEPSFTSFYAIIVFIGAVSALSGPVPFTRATAGCFSRHLGLAMGITLSGSSVVALMAIPTVSWVIHTFGWQMGFATISAIAAIVGLPFVILFLQKGAVSVPRQKSSVTAKRKGPRMAVFRSGQFWLLAIGFNIAVIPLGGFLNHLQPLLANKSVATATAATLGVVYAASISVGRLAGGYCLDRFSPFNVVIGFFTAAGLGCAALALSVAGSPILLILFAVTFIGFGHGAEVDFVSFFTKKVFGLEAFSTILGVLMMIGGISVGLGGLIFSKLFDVYGGYGVACLLGSACFFISALVFFGAKWHLKPYGAESRTSETCVRVGVAE